MAVGVDDAGVDMQAGRVKDLRLLRRVDLGAIRAILPSQASRSARSVPSASMVCSVPFLIKSIELPPV